MPKLLSSGRSRLILLVTLDLAAIDASVIDKAKSSFAINVRALDAIHVATAEILAAEAEGEPLEFWTHDERQATAAMSRGLTVRGLPDSLPSDAGTDVGISG